LVLGSLTIKPFANVTQKECAGDQAPAEYKLECRLARKQHQSADALIVGIAGDLEECRPHHFARRVLLEPVQQGPK